MAYLEWGNPHNSKVLICVHGLTRNARDFDNLAEVLASVYRVICVDIVGRGKSDWLDKAELYVYDTYINDIVNLLEYLKIDKVDWIGTSMGGLIGMFLNIKYPSIINNLILNDIGAFIPKESLRKIAKYVLFGKRNFANFTEALNSVKENYAGFGNLTEKQWEHLTKYSLIVEDNGGSSFNYDPKISY
jgi:pimeloyl-ACP methyl ester carboxylesterase